MNDNACVITRVSGPPYRADDGIERWLLNVRGPAGSLEELMEQVAAVLMTRPCAAMLRVYGAASDPSHVLELPSAAAAIPLLDRCEGVGVFDSEDVSRDCQEVVRYLADASVAGDDEALLLRAVHPRPVVFLHAGHDDIDVVCGRSDAEGLIAYLRGPRLS